MAGTIHLTPKSKTAGVGTGVFLILSVSNETEDGIIFSSRAAGQICDALSNERIEIWIEASAISLGPLSFWLLYTLRVLDLLRRLRGGKCLAAC